MSTGKEYEKNFKREQAVNIADYPHHFLPDYTDKGRETAGFPIDNQTQISMLRNYFV